MLKRYPFSFEIAGRLAIFRNPTSSPNSTSYPVPTISAIEGWIKSISMIPTAQAIVESVHICAPFKYVQLVFNNTTSSRKMVNIKAGNTEQYSAYCLSDVCYQVNAYTERAPEIPKAYAQYDNRDNTAHFYQERLLSRIENGQSYSIPFLGWREFTSNYFGVIRPETKTFEIDLEINMLVKTFSRFFRGEWKPVFDTVKVKQGIIHYGDMARKLNV